MESSTKNNVVRNPEEILLQTFSFDAKVEDTTNGVRLTVHAYSNDKKQLIEDATEIYVGLRRKKEFVFAPFK